MAENKSSLAAAAEVQPFIKARRRAENQSDVEAECADGARERCLRVLTLHQVLGLCSTLFITVVTTIIILFNSILTKIS